MDVIIFLHCVGIILHGLPVKQRQACSIWKKLLPTLFEASCCQIQNLVIIPQKILSVIHHGLPVCIFFIAVFQISSQWFVKACCGIMTGRVIIHRIIRYTVICSGKKSCLKADVENLFYQYRNVQMEYMCICAVCRICVGSIQ